MSLPSLKKRLSPDWLLDVMMYDKNHAAIIVSPAACLKHGVTNLQVAQGKFSSKTILHVRLDYDIRKVKKTR